MDFHFYHRAKQEAANESTERLGTNAPTRQLTIVSPLQGLENSLTQNLGLRAARFTPGYNMTGFQPCKRLGSSATVTPADAAARPRPDAPRGIVIRALPQG